MGHSGTIVIEVKNVYILGILLRIEKKLHDHVQRVEVFPVQDLLLGLLTLAELIVPLVQRDLPFYYFDYQLDR
jgi:hypothetical protein